ncbi:hypothetical protein CHIBITOTORO_00140 [Serratia phage vB_SmaM-ChibiTotoro]|nr:hypothetical protein CHIBITOTORO_00140 [Serratia phage vB_SmaM-ChibiTotoro]
MRWSVLLPVAKKLESSISPHPQKRNLPKSPSLSPLPIPPSREGGGWGRGRGERERLLIGVREYQKPLRDESQGWRDRVRDNQTFTKLYIKRCFTIACVQ